MSTVPDSDNDSRLSDETQRLRRAVRELTILNEIAVAISSTMQLEQLTRVMVEQCVKWLGVQQGTIHLFSSAGSDVGHTLVRVIGPTQDILPMRLGRQLTYWMQAHRKPLVSNDLAQDERFDRTEAKDLPIKSLLSVPLESKGRLTGVLSLFNKVDGVITEDDVRLAAIIATQCAQVIENARLRDEVAIYEEDMKSAAKIQQALLPRNAPFIPEVDIAGLSKPAREVGGDYFDYIDLGEGRWGIAVGDVSGKGMPAALLMSSLQATLRGCARIATSVADCVQNSNVLLSASTDARSFITLFYAVLDVKSHTLTYCNAGHNPPMIIRGDGTLRTLEVGGPIVAAFDQSTYQQEVVDFMPGSRLLMYTDGITEATNPGDEQYGEARLEQLVRSSARVTSRLLIERIIDDVLTFQKDASAADDMTLVCLSMRAVTSN